MAAALPPPPAPFRAALVAGKPVHLNRIGGRGRGSFPLGGCTASAKSCQCEETLVVAVRFFPLSSFLPPPSARPLSMPVAHCLAVLQGVTSVEEVGTTVCTMQRVFSFFYVRPSSLANIAVCVKACTLPTSPGFCCCRHCKHCSSHDLSVRMFIDKRGSGRHPLSYSRKRAGAVCRRTCSLVLCKYDEGGSAAGLRQATMRIPKEHVVVGPGGGYL